MTAARWACVIAVVILTCGVAPRHGYKIVNPNASATINGVRIIVREIAISRKEIVITMTLQNLQPGFATFPPYDRTTLTDDRDDVYRSIETRDWRLTDKQLFLGVRLAGNAQYTGRMRFFAPPGSAARELHLEISPVMREDPGAQPFAVQLPPIAVDP